MEIVYDDDEAIRVDDVLQHQCLVFIEDEVQEVAAQSAARFKGIEHTSFGGILKEVDLRGTVKRAKMILSLGRKELDCVVTEIDVETIRSVLDKRAVAVGIAHYDGRSALPIRFEIAKVNVTKDQPDLTRWRGAFERDEQEYDEPVW